MKINGPLDPLYANQNASATNGANASNAAQAAKGTTPVDRNLRSTASEASSVSHVTLSDQAKILQKARTALDETPDVRVQRVEEIKAAIANGTYRLDLRDLAQKIQTLLK